MAHIALFSVIRAKRSALIGCVCLQPVMTAASGRQVNSYIMKCDILALRGMSWGCDVRSRSQEGMAHELSPQQLWPQIFTADAAR